MAGIEQGTAPERGDAPPKAIVHAYRRASLLGRHGKLDLVAVAPGLWGSHTGGHERLRPLLWETADTHERICDVRALCRELGLVGQIGPGTATALLDVGVGDIDAKG